METDFRDQKGRFTEGNPGGPGRPRFSIVAMIREELEKVPEGQQENTARQKVKEYVDGLDDVGMRDLMDRFDGRAKQEIAISGGENPIGLIFVNPGEIAEDSSTSSSS